MMGSGLSYWLVGSSQKSTPSKHLQELLRSSELDRTKDAQDRRFGLVSADVTYTDSVRVGLTDAERKASNEILSGLQEDLNAIEIANAEVIYKMDNQYVQHTFIQISPPKPEQLGVAWESFIQRLAANNLGSSAVEDLWSKAQYMEKNYVGRRDLPFRVIHSFRAKTVKDAQGDFAIWSYEEKPEIRFSEYGSPFLSSAGGEGMVQAPDIHSKNNLARYGHLLPLMPELSRPEPSGAEQTKN
jgi:hypothetical protein